MKIPKTTFTTAVQVEAEYICYLAKSISVGFYSNSGYAVLPYAVSKNFQVSHFPDLDLSASFWREIIKSKNNDYGMGFPKKAVEEVVEKLEKHASIKQKEIDKITRVWQKRQSAFYSAVNDFLGAKSVVFKIESIEILLTPFGTAGSIYPKPASRGFVLNLTQRIDMPADMIGKTILIALHKIKTNLDGTAGNFDWFIKQNNVEYLLDYTIFRKILPEISRQGITNSAHSTKIISDSEAYLERLGFPSLPIIKAVDQKIIVRDKDITELFTPKERSLLVALLSNPGKLITFDEAAEAIWKDNVDFKFSLYALAKTVENIRRKIKNLGIYKEIIRTHRGKGYVFG